MKAEIKASIFIPILFLLSVLLLNTSFSWDYRYGNLAPTFLFYATIVWSFFHVVLLTTKKNISHKLIWLFLAAIPVLYLLFMMISGKD